MSRNFLSCDTDEANELDGREQKRSVAFLVRLAEQLSRLRESKVAQISSEGEKDIWILKTL